MIQFIEAHSSLAVVFILVVFGTVEIMAGLLDHKKRRRDDYLLEGISLTTLNSLIKPGLVLLVALLGTQIFPNAARVLSRVNFWLVLLLYLLLDDFMQYWYHRLAHQHGFFWKLHRPHHTALEMGLLVSYRNAALYYILMPNIWWLALVTFLGGGAAVAVGLVVKQIVIVSSHSPTKWDRLLYRYKALAPVACIMERILITPAFHYAHHGKSQADNISDPNGNFGNMFSVWDQLFGTAKFTRKYPAELGLPNDPNDNWAANFLFPLVKSGKKESEISKGFKRVKSTGIMPAVLELEAGDYLFCRCGYSKNQPFCDGSHHGTKFKPLLFTLEQKKRLKLCTCKLTSRAPYCDNSHLILEEQYKR